MESLKNTIENAISSGKVGSRLADKLNFLINLEELKVPLIFYLAIGNPDNLPQMESNEVIVSEYIHKLRNDEHLYCFYTSINYLSQLIPYFDKFISPKKVN